MKCLRNYSQSLWKLINMNVFRKVVLFPKVIVCLLAQKALEKHSQVGHQAIHLRDTIFLKLSLLFMSLK